MGRAAFCCYRFDNCPAGRPLRCRAGLVYPERSWRAPPAIQIAWTASSKLQKISHRAARRV